MNRRQFLSAAAATGLTALGARNASAQAPSRPNILWISLDDGRADTLGCYNAPWSHTPHLDALAGSGVRFENAIVQCPVCVPSRRSMKTGCYVHSIGPMAMGKDPEVPAPYLDRARMAEVEGRPNLLDAFTAAGMKPVNCGKIHGFPDSFDDRGDAPGLLDVSGIPTPYFKKVFGENSPLLDTPRTFTDTHHWQIGGILDVDPVQTETWRLGDMAVKTLNELTAKSDPFFMRVSFHAPHVPNYVPRDFFVDPATIDIPLPTKEELASKPAFERGPLRTYCAATLTPDQIALSRGTHFGMVALVDVQIGRIIDELKKAGRLDNTIVCLTSDQGYQVGEHGLWKKRVFYEGNVRTPFFIAGPGVPEGKVLDAPVELVDFLPTLLDLSDLDVPGDIDGRSLMPLIQGKEKTWREATFCEIDHSQSMYEELRHTGRRVMVGTAEWKLETFMDPRVTTPDGSLYHLADDPGETKNLFGDPTYADVTQKLHELARDWDATTAA